MLGLMSLKHAKHYDPNTGLLGNSESTKKTQEAGRLFDMSSDQQTHNASKRISPSIRQQNKTGWLIGNYYVVFESLINYLVILIKSFCHFVFIK